MSRAEHQFRRPILRRWALDHLPLASRHWRKPTRPLRFLAYSLKVDLRASHHLSLFHAVSLGNRGNAAEHRHNEIIHVVALGYKLLKTIKYAIRAISLDVIA